MPTSKSPLLSSSGFMNHLRMGSVRIPHHFLTIRMEPWDIIKSSALYLSVHMELSLCLSFYLRRNIGVYMVATTVGFLVEIMEAFAPHSHNQIPRKCPQYI
jgi:hypothetical protein